MACHAWSTQYVVRSYVIQFNKEMNLIQNCSLCIELVKLLDLKNKNTTHKFAIFRREFLGLGNINYKLGILVPSQYQVSSFFLKSRQNNIRPASIFTMPSLGPTQCRGARRRQAEVISKLEHVGFLVQSEKHSRQQSCQLGVVFLDGVHDVYQEQ